MENGDHHLSLQWQVLYEAAVLELDRAKLLPRIAEAEHAIRMALEKSNPASDGVEKEALGNALTVLHDLRQIANDDRRD